MVKDYKAQLQKLVDRFKGDVNGVVLHMLTDALGGSVRPPPKRGGALLQAELENSLAVAAQVKRPKLPKRSAADQKAYQKAWRLRKKKDGGKKLTKAQERWLKRYDARTK